jgi:hypothetical protein
MPQPAGAKNIWWRVMQDGYGGSGFFDMSVLYIGLEGTAATEQAVKNWFGSNGWTSYSDGSRSMPRYTKTNARAGHDFANVASSGSNMIIAGVIQAGAWPGNTAWGCFGLSGLTMSPAAVMGKVSDGSSGLEVTMYGGKAVYDNLLNQLTAKMGKGQDLEGDGYLTFWDAKTSVVAYLGYEGEEVWLTAEKR